MRVWNNRKILNLSIIIYYDVCLIILSSFIDSQNTIEILLH